VRSSESAIFVIVPPERKQCIAQPVRRPRYPGDGFAVERGNSGETGIHGHGETRDMGLERFRKDMAALIRILSPGRRHRGHCAGKLREIVLHADRMPFAAVATSAARTEGARDPSEPSTLC